MMCKKLNAVFFAVVMLSQDSTILQNSVQFITPYLFKHSTFCQNFTHFELVTNIVKKNHFTLEVIDFFYVNVLCEFCNEIFLSL